ncbi:hypothetical protein M0812_28937 [Anaeramoeba flamelloides]|uniref:Uncharacterized protein n=1 Tax=Anaeramoeba flamelloides TaxID=1746091 RepID=A0AAV7Y9K8_9EUKA|nr:hypothetical protein M0812_28937 [Anaeramoeba flamelloides]
MENELKQLKFEKLIFEEDFETVKKHLNNEKRTEKKKKKKIARMIILVQSIKEERPTNPKTKNEQIDKQNKQIKEQNKQIKEQKIIGSISKMKKVNLQALTNKNKRSLNWKGFHKKQNPQQEHKNAR